VYSIRDTQRFIDPEYRNPYYRPSVLSHADHFADIPAYFVVPLEKFCDVHFYLFEDLLGQSHPDFRKENLDLFEDVVRCLYNDYIVLKNDPTSRVGENQQVIYLMDVLHMNGTLVVNGLYHVMAAGFYHCFQKQIDVAAATCRPDTSDIPLDPRNPDDRDDIMDNFMRSVNTTNSEHRLYNLSRELDAIDAAHYLNPFAENSFANTEAIFRAHVY
jgi:hypothetical protein